MRLKAITIIAAIILTAFAPARSQEAAVADTIYNPPVLFNGMPRTYESSPEYQSKGRPTMKTL